MCQKTRTFTRELWFTHVYTLKRDILVGIYIAPYMCTFILIGIWVMCCSANTGVKRNPTSILQSIDVLFVFAASITYLASVVLRQPAVVDVASFSWFHSRKSSQSSFNFCQKNVLPKTSHRWKSRGENWRTRSLASCEKTQRATTLR